jgi:hypothetical protein
MAGNGLGAPCTDFLGCAGGGKLGELRELGFACCFRRESGAIVTRNGGSLGGLGGTSGGSTDGLCSS